MNKQAFIAGYLNKEGGDFTDRLKRMWENPETKRTLMISGAGAAAGAGAGALYGHLTGKSKLRSALMGGAIGSGAGPAYYLGKNIYKKVKPFLFPPIESEKVVREAPRPQTPGEKIMAARAKQTSRPTPAATKLMEELKSKGKLSKSYKDLLESGVLYGSKEKGLDVLQRAQAYRRANPELTFEQSLSKAKLEFKVPYTREAIMPGQDATLGDTVDSSAAAAYTSFKNKGKPEIGMLGEPEPRAAVHEAGHATQDIKHYERYKIYKGEDVTFSKEKLKENFIPFLLAELEKAPESLLQGYKREDVAKAISSNPRLQGLVISEFKPYLFNDSEIEARLMGLRQIAERAAIPIDSPLAARNFLATIGLQPTADPLVAKANIQRAGNIPTDIRDLISLFNMLLKGDQEKLLMKFISRLPGLVRMGKGEAGRV